MWYFVCLLLGGLLGWILGSVKVQELEMELELTKMDACIKKILLTQARIDRLKK